MYSYIRQDKEACGGKHVPSRTRICTRRRRHRLPIFQVLYIVRMKMSVSKMSSPNQAYAISATRPSDPHTLSRDKDSRRPLYPRIHILDPAIYANNVKDGLTY